MTVARRLPGRRCRRLGAGRRLRSLGLDAGSSSSQAPSSSTARAGNTGSAAAAPDPAGLADGRVIDSRRVRGVLNRLLWVSAEGFAGASESDREYAGGELYALVQSWLASARRAGDQPPGRHRLAGSVADGRPMAGARPRGRPGDPALPGATRPPTPPAVRRVLVIDGRVVDDDGAPDDCPRRGAERLARIVDLDLLEARFDDDWAFADASLLPAIASPDEGRVDAVAPALRARAA